MDKGTIIESKNYDNLKTALETIATTMNKSDDVSNLELNKSQWASGENIILPVTNQFRSAVNRLENDASENCCQSNCCQTCQGCQSQSCQTTTCQTCQRCQTCQTCQSCQTCQKK